MLSIDFLLLRVVLSSEMIIGLNWTDVKNTLFLRVRLVTWIGAICSQNTQWFCNPTNQSWMHKDRLQGWCKIWNLFVVILFINCEIEVWDRCEWVERFDIYVSLIGLLSFTNQLLPYSSCIEVLTNYLKDKTGI